MIASRLSPARLNGTLENELRTLEASFGCLIVAYQYEAALADLSPSDYARVQRLERDLGISLVAYEPISRYKMAQPSAQQLAQIHALERELDLVLVAYHHEQAPPPEPAITSPDTPLAQLAEDQYERLHQIEEQTGLVLMAYSAGSAGAGNGSGASRPGAASPSGTANGSA